MYRQYKLRKDELEGRIKQPTAIEQNLWHGTSADANKSINTGGFNRSYCGKNGMLFTLNVIYVEFVQILSGVSFFYVLWIMSTYKKHVVDHIGFE